MVHLVVGHILPSVKRLKAYVLYVYYLSTAKKVEKKLNSRSLFLPDAPKSTSVSVSPSGEIVEGSPVTLTCSSNANPPVQRYSWFKSSDMLERKQSLFFADISSGDSGQYYCEAQNRIGNHTSTAVTVDVQYAPKSTSVSVSPSGEIVEGSPVTLTCSSNANPPVQRYSWFQSMIQLGLKPRTSRTVILLSQLLSTLGLHCQDTLFSQTLNDHRLLSLPDAPKSTSVSVSPSGEIVEGSPVTLTCSSNANPPVQRYSWFQSSGAAVWEKGSGQSLNISNFSSGDSGQYYCEAQNKHGAHNSTAVPLTITGTVRITHRDMSVAFSGNCQISLC
ncbi:CD22 protein, partial [Amia calva]|nr:CD22 protein [Amia calva]